MVAGLGMARSGHSPSAERAGRMPGQVRACPGGRRVFRVGPAMARSGHSPSAGHAGSMLGQEPRAHGADTCSGFVAFGFKLLDQVAADLHWVSARVLGRAHVES